MPNSKRTEMRKVFYDSFRKHHEKQLLEPLEAQIIQIIMLHPEYHPLLSDADTIHTDDFAEQNPFFHLSLHLAIHEQIQTDRPAGIQKIYHALNDTLQDPHQAQHIMMDCLAQSLWEGQQSGTAPNEENYLQMLKALL